MKTPLLLIIFLIFTVVFQSPGQQIPSKEVQIKNALLAAPSGFKEGAKVYGYNEKGEFVVLREGTNDMICLADDPSRPGFSAACYHKDLEPLMARGRALKKEGKSFDEIFKIRAEEAKSGKLKMPEKGATLFVYSVPEEKYDNNTGDAANGSLRYVVYLPYATAESTGLPLSPDAPGMPWIMDPGTYHAHIMITPPAKDE